MRILFWSSFWPIIGGIEVRAAKLLPALRERGYEFIVVTAQVHPDLPVESEFRGIPVYRFRFGGNGKNLDQLLTIRERISMIRDSFGPDLVHKNGFGVESLFCLTTAHVHPAPLLVTLCNDLQTQSLEHDTLLGRLLRSADWVNSVSEAALVQARQLVPKIATRSSVIHNGIDGRDFLPKPPPADGPRLLCLGRLSHQKGIDIALNALPLVIKQFPRTRLVVAGDGWERKALEEQAARMGLSQAVEFRGWVPPEQVPAVLACASIVVMPSRWEGFPNVALQAALMARPVIGTRVGGTPEIIEHQRTGILVEAENSTALAEAIIQLLSQPETAGRMGRAAWERAESEFSWEHYVDAYDALYRKLIRRERGESADLARV